MREQKIVDISYTKKGQEHVESFPITQLGAVAAVKYWNKIGTGTMTDEDNVKLVCESLSWTEKKFDEHFIGKVSVVGKLIEEIVELNFSDFLGELDLEEQAE